MPRILLQSVDITYKKFSSINTGWYKNAVANFLLGGFE